MTRDDSTLGSPFEADSPEPLSSHQKEDLLRAAGLITRPQHEALAVLNGHPQGSAVSSTTDPRTNTVHHRAAAGLVAHGLCEYLLGGDGRYIRRTEA